MQAEKSLQSGTKKYTVNLTCILLKYNEGIGNKKQPLEVLGGLNVLKSAYSCKIKGIKEWGGPRV